MAGIVTALRSFLRLRANDAEMDEELRFHLDRETEENIRRGMSPREAAESARLSFGRMEQLKEECREARSGRAIETTLQDVRHALRVFRNSPLFAATVIATLALGIGANTAIFSVVYGVLLRPLPYANAGRIVVLHQQAQRAGVADMPFSAKEIFDYRDKSTVLDGVVEHHSMVFSLIGPNTAERVQTAVVSSNFFDVLGVKPLLGRTFTAADERHGAQAVLILSHRYWKSRMGGDQSIIGRVFQMNSLPHVVIGVLPPIPQYPSESDVYMPTSQCPTRSSDQFVQNRKARMLTAFARLKPDVTLKQAQAELSTLAGQIELANPDSYPKADGYGIEARSLREDLTRRARLTFVILLGAAAFVLSVACANVANLLLSRLVRVERELAVRSALGASRLRLMRQLLTESATLAFLGGAAGVAVARPAAILLGRFAERFTTRAAEVRVDTPVLLFAFALAMITGIAFGVAPAIIVTRRISDPLRAASGRFTASRGRQLFRSSLVVAQVAVSVVLLAGAGLMARTVLELSKVDLGFQPQGLLAMRITPNSAHYRSPEKLDPMFASVLREASALPGVVSASLVSNPPFSPGGIASGPGNTQFEVEGQQQQGSAPRVDITVVSPEYFATIRQRMISGREFTDKDDAERMQVGIINETMSRRRFADVQPLGKRITLDGGRMWVTIVGVVGDAKEYGLDRPVPDELYLPLKQQHFAGNLLMRIGGAPESVIGAAKAALLRIDPEIAVDRINTIQGFVDDSIAAPRTTAALLGLFSTLAMLISAAGIAAVMALAVNQRRHELGVRIALGATHGSVLRTVVVQGVALAAVGVAIGLAGAMSLNDLLSSFLFGVGPRDATTLAGTAALFLIVAVVSCWIPGRQVTSLDPVVALRHD